MIIRLSKVELFALYAEMSCLKYPKTIIDFQKMFRTEEDCAQYVYQCRWLKGFGCPKCKVESEKLYSISTCKRYECLLKGWPIQEKAILNQPDNQDY